MASLTPMTPQIVPQTITPVSIQDLEAGNVDIDTLLQQIEFLQHKLEKIRYDMFMYINAMSSIEETSIPSEIYKDISNRVITLKTEFNTFFAAYKCVLPVIRYFKIKQGMSPDDAIKIVPRRVHIDPKLLADISTTKNNTNDLDLVQVSAAVSSASTPLNVTAATTAATTASANNTPSSKRSQPKPTKRKTAKKV